MSFSLKERVCPSLNADFATAWKISAKKRQIKNIKYTKVNTKNWYKQKLKNVYKYYSNTEGMFESTKDFVGRIS